MGADTCLHELFEAQVARRPQAIAVVCGEQRVTYEELNAWANEVAGRLREVGVGPDALVAVCLERGVPMVVALLAIVKAGGAYVPLDPSYPLERLRFMLADCSPVALLVDGAWGADILPEDEVRVAVVEAGEPPQFTDAQPNLSRAETGVRPDHLAYAIYTSGSTGLPKGVMVEHRQVTRLFAATAGWFGFGENDLWTLFHSMAFDFSVWEMWGALLHGGCLVVVPWEVSRSPSEFYELVCRERVTVLNQTPSAFRQFIAAQEQSGAAHALRCVVFGGEALDAAALAPWYAREANRDVRLVNMYGITETTVHVTYRPLTSADVTAGVSPIGVPLPDLRTYVLDGRGAPAPVGVPGELFVGGAGVARGYLNRPELTAQRFLPDPFAGGEGRMYRTGDVVRRRPDGSLEYVGRNDFQVKIRGYRIELGEIEERLRDHPGVGDSVVVALGDTLVAYHTGDAVPAEALREHLAARLPDYMVPTAYVHLAAFSLTVNGKLDRQALPAPDGGSFVRREYVPPQGHAETVIAQLWGELLGIEAVGRHDDFFKLGGHSLVAVRFLSRLRARMGVDLDLGALFAEPMLADVARAAEAALPTRRPPITAMPPAETAVLSFAQQRLWFLAQLEGVSAAYQMSAAFRLVGDLDGAVLRRALDRIVDRQEVLRTTFGQADGEPVQRIAPPGAGIAWAQDDLRAQHDVVARRDEVIDHEARMPFALARGPLIRARLIRESDREHTLLFTMHHIVSDGWSMGVLAHELGVLYAAFIDGRPDPLPPSPIQYADYAVWQREWLDDDELARQCEYWTTTLAGAPALCELPAAGPRPAVQDFAGGFVGCGLDVGLTGRLRALSDRHGVTLFTTLLASWALLVSRLSGQDDVVIGIPTANRDQPEVEGLIGFFVNMLPIRLDAGGSPTVGEWLGQVKARALAAQAHQDVPFERIVELVQPARSLAHNPVFQVAFGWQAEPPARLELPGITVEPAPAAAHLTSRFDLALVLSEADRGVRGGAEFATALFDADTVTRYLGHWHTLLEAMTASDTTAVDRLPLLSAGERGAMIAMGNEGTAPDRPGECVHELFEEQAARTPDATAVIHGDEQLGYAELNLRANRLAHHLRGCGAGRGGLVGICAHRSIDMVVAMLAVLKAGAAYLPLDPSYPPDRLRYMVQDSTPVAVLVDGDRPEWAAGRLIVDLSAAEACSRQPADNPARADGMTPHDLAYVIYTSGSTGAPKAVMTPHRGIPRLAIGNRYADFRPGDRTAFAANPAFDAATMEVWAPLLTGGCVVVIDQDELLDPVRFGRVLSERRVDLMFMTNSLFDRHAETAGEALSGLRYLMVGGDVMDPKLVARFLGRHRPAHFLQAYGPTETTTFAMMHEVFSVPPQAQRIPIGRPIAATSVYVLDACGEPLPIGVVGELFIGGDGVALGYLNRPELTAERFRPDPFAGGAARMYATGDLGRRLPDGTIEFFGRDDSQVKLRGFRVELGEIESCLTGHPAVRAAAVLARTDADGEKQLVAYYVRAAGDVVAETLRTYLSARLPEYIIPAAYVELPAMPLTPSGKLDRMVLPVPGGEAFVRHAYEEPADGVEAAIAGLWSELLGVDRIGRRDDFFVLGGHSLVAVQLVSRLRSALGVDIALDRLFAAPVLADFAAAVSGALAPRRTAITPRPSGDTAELSFAQRRLWFLSQLDGESPYHIPIALHLAGEVHVDALRRALDRIVARHEVLRTTFTKADGEPVQRIAPPGEGIAWSQDDLRGRGDAEAERDRLMELQARQPFDLERGPLVRVRLLRMDEREFVLVLTMHHIVSDGWSLGVLTRELSVLYGAFVRGEPDPLPPLAVQYADYAHWQRRELTGARLERLGEYWVRTLSGAPVLSELPADRPRRRQQDFAGGSVRCALDAELTERLRAFSRRHGVTLFVTLLASWAATVARLSGQQDLIVGTPTANRGEAEIEDLIGFFANTLPLRLDITGPPTVSQWLDRVKAQALAAQAHQDLPFDRIVELMQPTRSLSHNPLVQVVFVWQAAGSALPQLPGVRVTDLPAAPYVTSQFELSLKLTEVGGRIAGGAEYATALFDRDTVQRYLGHWRTLLEAVLDDDSVPVDRLPLVTSAERARLLELGTGAALTWPDDKLVHELFEAQARRSPDAVAVEDGAERLTYAQLNARANRVAHRLRALGIRPDDLVAIGAERGIAMVAGVLGVLKAGAAYLPLDPAYPAERLGYLLRDAAPKAILAPDTMEPTWLYVLGAAEVDIPVIDLPASDSATVVPDLARAETGVRPSHLAYVIYTSGSTGSPKGVMVTHRGLSNYLRWAVDAYPARLGSVVSSSLSFDATVTSLFSPLLGGGRVLVLGEHEEIDRLAGEIGREGCGVVKLTPGHLEMLGRLVRREGGAVRAAAFVVGGEALPGATVELWRDIEPGLRLINEYGPTETVVGCVVHEIPSSFDASLPVPIGRPIANMRVYVLDQARQPVPAGVTGEIHLGGPGVARGYLNRPDLTAERFVDDPFAGAGERMYVTGDLGRWRPDGTLEYLGRNDLQVKLHGYRIEPGEIEACLAGHAGLREAVVQLREDEPGQRQLVAYYLAEDADAPLVESLRVHVSARLPAYMVPAAYVRLEAMPLTANGKLDRSALPAPGGESYSRQRFEPAREGAEAVLAEIWSGLLNRDRIGRHDNFFELGGHSLLGVVLLERMRQRGLVADVGALYTAPTLAELAASAQRVATEPAKAAPAGGIPAGATSIIPDMLDLITLTQSEIDAIVAAVPGGAANVQDIYPLAPLQEGVLFHHLLASEGDPYLLTIGMSFDTRERLQRYLAAFQAVVDRHDILRTAVRWEGLPEPVQVVWRRAPLVVEEVPVSSLEQLRERFNPRRHRIDVRHAPMIRMYVAHDTARDRWVLLTLGHHLMDDNTTFRFIFTEIQAFLSGRGDSLPAPLPFRTFVAQRRQAADAAGDAAFFRAMLGDIDEPTAPFGLVTSGGDGRQVAEGRMTLEAELSGRLRERVRQLGVSAASICHTAWAQVLSRLTGRTDVVFGTVLFGRMQGAEGVDRAMGPFINTLPLRLTVDGTSAEASVRETHAKLAELLRHEHASLALAQRCSAVRAPAPVFTSLLNYRHIVSAAALSPESAVDWAGINWELEEERTNYPLLLSVDDLGDDLRLVVQVLDTVDPVRVCEFMRTALLALVDALGREPGRALAELDVMPAAEGAQIMAWNDTTRPFPGDVCLHELVETQAARTPDAIAVLDESVSLTYAELNARANRLARRLLELGVRKDSRVAICAERGARMVIGLLAVLKAGGAYVPLDPSYPAERLAYMLHDAAPVALLVHGDSAAPVVAAAHSVPVVRLAEAPEHRDDNLARDENGVTPVHLAYVIYTSGSTGQPKGVMNEHRGIVNRLQWMLESYRIGAGDAVLAKTPLGFDISVWEIFWPLACGARLVMARPDGHKEPEYLARVIKQHQVTAVHFVPSMLQAFLACDAAADPAGLRWVICSGEALSPGLLRRFRQAMPGVGLVNLYGPTEAAVEVTAWECPPGAVAAVVPIGRPLANTRIYVLDPAGRLAPIGVAGELLIGGVQVARGYLNRPELTAERFGPDPFAGGVARMYRTGDLARWLPDGTIEYLGRNDFQVKIRGFRIELGEIEAALAECADVTETVVVAREDAPGDKRLTAYYLSAEPLAAQVLRRQLLARLPDYMVPAAFVHLAAFPLLPNGKLDRKALPAPDRAAFVRHAYAEPQGEAEQTLAAIWSELLGVERVGRLDDFFALGGHSLLAITLMERMRRAGMSVDIRTLFDTPALAELAGTVSTEAEPVRVPPNLIPPLAGRGPDAQDVELTL